MWHSRCSAGFSTVFLGIDHSLSINVVDIVGTCNHGPKMVRIDKFLAMNSMSSQVLKDLIIYDKFQAPQSSWLQGDWGSLQHQLSGKMNMSCGANPLLLYIHMGTIQQALFSRFFVFIATVAMVHNACKG